MDLTDTVRGVLAIGELGRRIFRPETWQAPYGGYLTVALLGEGGDVSYSVTVGNMSVRGMSPAAVGAAATTLPDLKINGEPFNTFVPPGAAIVVTVDNRDAVATSFFAARLRFSPTPMV